jgi:hypothetical protein
MAHLIDSFLDHEATTAIEVPNTSRLPNATELLFVPTPLFCANKTNEKQRDTMSNPLLFIRLYFFYKNFQLTGS